MAHFKKLSSTKQFFICQRGLVLVPMSLANFNVAHSDCSKIAMWLGESNQSALFQHSIFTTLDPTTPHRFQVETLA